MRITVKNNPNPSFCEHSLITMSLSEFEFEDISEAIEMLCTNVTPSQEFRDRLETQYQPRMIAAQEKIYAKYKPTNNEHKDSKTINENR